MNFSTIVDLPESQLQLTPQSNVMFIGSCFADHMGQRLSQCLAPQHIRVNPHGTLYNPVSIRNTLVTYLPQSIEAPFKNAGFFQLGGDNGEWRHWDYSTLFSAPTQEELKQQLLNDWEQMRRFFAQLDVLFITFSTDHVYWINEGPYNDYCAANCHKQPARMFHEEVESWRDLEHYWHYFLSDLHQELPQLKVVFTLSPYRYAKYGMHENALSKARLLLLIDKLCNEWGVFVSYFPAYEIITDELRDYRFYAPDMLHPSEQAIDYVWEQFSEWAFTPQLHEYAHERQAILRSLQHRAINPHSAEHKAFLHKLALKQAQFKAKWGEGIVEE